MSSAEPDKNKFPYAGWVPTVNGRLSFRHVGESEHPRRSIYANVATDKRRIILCYQARPSGDVLFPWALSAFFGITGKFWFALTAESNDVPSASDHLSGTIYIFKSKEDWRENGEPHIRTTIHNINDHVRFSDAAARDFEIRAGFTKAQQDLSKGADVSVNVERRRSIVIFLIAGSATLAVTVYFGWPAVVSIARQLAAIWTAVH